MKRKRLFDDDNAFSSVKPILDALVHWQIIKDDASRWCKLKVTQEVSKDIGTTIEVT